MNKEDNNINIFESSACGVLVSTFKKLATLLNCRVAFFIAPP